MNFSRCRIYLHLLQIVDGKYHEQGILRFHLLIVMQDYYVPDCNQN